MSPRVALRFDERVPRDRHAPIDHAFRVWAASRHLAVTDAARADAVFTYGGDDAGALPASDGVTGRPTMQHGLPWYFGAGTRLDHLVEVHAWVAALSEHDAPVDPIGRIDRSSSMAATLGVDPCVAWAERHLDAFDRVALALHPQLDPVLSRKRSGVTVLGTHDLDFLPVKPGDTGVRLARNLAVAALTMRDPRLVASITGAASTRLLRRRPALGGVDAVMELERRHEVRSTWNVLVAQLHARDANYAFDDSTVRSTLDALAARGHEIGLHGSYTSAGRPGALAREMATLRAAGHDGRGVRQHWLRHAGAPLYQELSAARARYDSSFGWSDACGFRHGMARPFIPFDTTTNQPASVFEVPLVMMDVALSDMARRGVDPAVHAAAVLEEAGRHGGTVSVLWHDTTVSDTQIRRGVGPLYERLLARGDRWITSAEAVDAARPVWLAAGFALD